MSVGQLAVSWALSHESVTSAIVGARKSGQITEIVKAADHDLTEKDEIFVMNQILFEDKLENG